MKRIFLCLLMSLTAVLGFSNILDDSEQSQRFELYPTQNTFNFLKLDKKTGKIYQVQWSLEGEKEFSINLFVRSKNHVTLTKEGELFYQKAQDMLRYIKESSSELHDLGRQTPPVRIGIPPLLSTVYFPDIYVEFSKIHPEIHLELFEYGSIRAASLVNEEALDVSLVNMDFYDIDKMNSS